MGVPNKVLTWLGLARAERKDPNKAPLWLELHIRNRRCIDAIGERLEKLEGRDLGAGAQVAAAPERPIRPFQHWKV